MVEFASSAALLSLQVNCSGSRSAGRHLLMCCITKHSKHFVTKAVRATGRKSGFGLFGTGMIVALLRQVGTTAYWSEMLKMSVDTSFSCSAHFFRTHPGMLSGPAALCGVKLASAFRTTAVVSCRTWLICVGRSGCACVV